MPTRLERAAAAALPAMRLTARAMLHTAYRLETRGFEANVPAEGPGVLVYNHVAFHDWLLVAAASPRLPRFVMHHHHWKYPALRWFFEAYRAIPIAARKEDPALLDRAMETIDAALRAGELVAISPEGSMTPDGRLQTFRPGFERIAKRTGAPVVPIAIRGLFGSCLSRDGGEPMTKLPKRFRAKVELVCDTPIPAAHATADTLRAHIAAMLANAPPPARGRGLGGGRPQAARA